MASNLRVDSIVPSTGANVSIGTATGGVTIPGNLGVAGVLTYEDVTNVDSIGIITARDMSKVIMLGNYGSHKSKSLFSREELDWQEQRNRRRVRKLDFEVR